MAFGTVASIYTVSKQLFLYIFAKNVDIIFGFVYNIVK